MVRRRVNRGLPELASGGAQSSRGAFEDRSGLRPGLPPEAMGHWGRRDQLREVAFSSRKLKMAEVEADGVPKCASCEALDFEGGLLVVQSVLHMNLSLSQDAPSVWAAEVMPAKYSLARPESKDTPAVT